MIIEILRHTPIWVWVILVGLVAIGSTMLRARAISARRMVILPAAMLVYSLASIMAAFSGNWVTVPAWAAGVLAALLLSRWLRVSADVRYEQATALFHLPGSVAPMFLMIAIFCVKFAIGAAAAIMPAVLTDAQFIAAISIISGLLSGAFLARSLLAFASRVARHNLSLSSNQPFAQVAAAKLSLSSH